MIFGEDLGLNFGYCWSLDIDGVEYELMRRIGVIGLAWWLGYRRSSQKL